MLAVVLGTASWAASCATTEPPAFSDGTCVAGGCAQTGGAATTGPSTTTGPACVPDAGCAVSWSNDIFTGIIDGPPGCTATGLCHGAGGGGITLTTGQPAAAYTALMAYTIASGGPKYIVPCHPETSGFPCNMAVAAGATDPYSACGIAMPFGGNGMPLTLAQLQSITDWIQCGAPNN